MCVSSGRISFSQASLTAAGLPGIANTNNPLGSCPASAREMQRLLGQQPVDPEMLRGQRSLF